MYLVLIIGFLLGFIFGCVVVLLRHGRTIAGTLRIDHSNPGKDIYRFDIEDLDRLSSKQFVTLRVDNNAHLSHE